MRYRFAALLCAAVLPVGASYTSASASIRLTPSAQHKCTTNQTGVIPVRSAGGHIYEASANEYNSNAPEVACLDADTAITVASSSINVPTDGAPGAYTSLYRGNHWKGMPVTPASGLPLPVKGFASAGHVHLSMSTTLPPSGIYDDSFDIFFVPPGDTRPCPQTELMIWLDHAGPVHPGGTVLAQRAKVGSHYFAVSAEWTSAKTALISYVFNVPRTSVAGLALAPFVEDAVKRGYLPASDNLIDVEGGFEIWKGSAGAAVASLAVTTPAGS